MQLRADEQKVRKHQSNKLGTRVINLGHESMIQEYLFYSKSILKNDCNLLRSKLYINALVGCFCAYSATLKMGVKQPSPMNPALRNQNVQENSII